MSRPRMFLYGLSSDEVAACHAEQALTAIERRNAVGDAFLLRRTIRAAATVSLTEDEAVRRIRAVGAALEPFFDPAAGVVGYAARWPDRRGRLGPAIRDVDLGPDVRLSELRNGWLQSPELEIAALAEWRHPSSRPPVARDTVPLTAPKLWIRALNDAYLFRGTLLEYRPDEVQAWQWAAARLVGVVSIWSQRAEFGTPGPLAFAAEALARYASAPGARHRPTRPAPACDLGHVALVLGHLGAHDSMTESLLQGQVIAAVTAVARAARERGDTVAAVTLGDMVIAPLTAVRRASQADVDPRRDAPGGAPR
ncbi:hypothetical protein [Nocardia blacklockiae]|uniref:hypothetical protein n=1 Tax=Nocardia blacklockiae TaxID=480036 RepID=UPI001892E106|nr:hypothetical protein [Nocardia blacklockiae]MBF6171148.1 hypothetical protein [Nocardia blacklockiae]